MASISDSSCLCDAIV